MTKTKSVSVAFAFLHRCCCPLPFLSVAAFQRREAAAMFSLSLPSLSSLVPSLFCVLFFPTSVFAKRRSLSPSFPNSRARDKEGAVQVDGQYIRFVCDNNIFTKALSNWRISDKAANITRTPTPPPSSARGLTPRPPHTSHSFPLNVSRTVAQVSFSFESRGRRAATAPNGAEERLWTYRTHICSQNCAVSKSSVAPSPLAGAYLLSPPLISRADVIQFDPSAACTA